MPRNKLAVFALTLVAISTVAQQTAQPSDPYSQSSGQQQECTAEMRATGTCSNTSPRTTTEPGYEQQENTLPVIRNDSRDSVQSSADRDRALERQQHALVQSPEPPELNEFQEFVTLSVGRKLPVFGYNLFRNVPSTFAPVDRVPVPANYVIGPRDEIQIRAWGQVDINYRAVVDNGGNIYLPRVGEIHLAGVRYSELSDTIRSAIGRIFRNFELSATMGQLRSIQIFVVGQARRPGNYTVSSLSTLVNALFATGGPSQKGSLRRIQLRRSDRVVTEFDLYDLLIRGDKSKDVQLQPGDVLYIPPAGKMAAIAGSVGSPAIYEVKEDTTLGDLLDLAGGLSATAAGQRVTIERISERTVRKMDEFPLDKEGLRRTIQDGDVVNVFSLSKRFENAVTLRGNVAVPGRFPWHPGMRVKDLIPNRQALITNEYWLNQNASINPERSREETSRRTALRNEEGKTASSGPMQANPADVERPLRDQETLQNEIRHNAPEINWEYAVIQRLNEIELTSELIPFNLRNAIDQPASADNVALSPGDVVTVFSQADVKVPVEQQSKYVRIEGEFKQAGIYKVLPGETLQQLVLRMGGLSPRAYLFGSVFTRESTRISQQKKMDESLTRLSQEVERSASERAQNISSPEEGLGLGARIDSQRRLVEALRQVKATGRIVLGLNPLMTATEDLPGLTLEDGDRLFIPYTPSTVTVIGAVYNENDFIYKPGRRVRDYIRQSGGTTRSADNARVYVIRADGSLRGKQSGAGWLNASLENERLMPGDTIVVPERLDRTKFIKNLKDYTQIFTQFALGAAAINVLK